jgi:hypothetical protein
LQLVTKIKKWTYLANTNLKSNLFRIYRRQKWRQVPNPEEIGIKKLKAMAILEAKNVLNF